MPVWAQVVIGLLGAGLVASLVQLSSLRSQLRHTDAESTASEVATSTTLFDQVETLRSRLLVSEDRAGKAERENAELRDRISRLERVMPMALIADRITADLDDLAALFDLSGELWFVTSSDAEGMFVWCSSAVCRVLGRQREEVVSIGWRRLIHPEDLAEAERAEASAWDRRVWGHPNRYQKADGTYVRFRWYCPRYASGTTLSLVKVVAEPAAPAAPLP